MLGAAGSVCQQNRAVALGPMGNWIVPLFIHASPLLFLLICKEPSNIFHYHLELQFKNIRKRSFKLVGLYPQRTPP